MLDSLDDWLLVEPASRRLLRGSASRQSMIDLRRIPLTSTPDVSLHGVSTSDSAAGTGAHLTA